MNGPLYVHASDVKFQELTSRHVAIYYANDVHHVINEWADMIDAGKASEALEEMRAVGKAAP